MQQYSDLSESQKASMVKPSALTLFLADLLQSDLKATAQGPMALADKLNISYGTIHNILRLATELPNEGITFKIFKYYSVDHRTQMDLINDFYPETAGLIKNIVAANPDNAVRDLPEMNHVVASVPRYRLFTIIRDQPGRLTRNDIVSRYGPDSGDTVDQLLLRGILKQDESGQLAATVQNSFDTIQSLQKKKCENMLDILDPDHKSSYFPTVTNSVNMETYEEVRNRLRTFVIDVIRDLKDPSKHGDIPLVLGSILGTFDKKMYDA